MDPTSIAIGMMRADPSYVADARAGAPLGNSIIGSLMSLLHGIPRQNSEQAVRAALRIIDGAPE